MISVPLARRLKECGLAWEPRLHDLFVIPDRDLDGQVFAVSEMTIDVDDVAGRTTIMFNGAAEWSLDYVMHTEAVWLPSEEQLRERLGGRLVSLVPAGKGYRCRVEVAGDGESFEALDACDAYAYALLALMAEVADAGEPTPEGGLTPA